MFYAFTDDILSNIDVNLLCRSKSRELIIWWSLCWTDLRIPDDTILCPTKRIAKITLKRISAIYKGVSEASIIQVKNGRVVLGSILKRL